MAQENEGFQCEKCLNKLPGRKGRELALKQVQDINGCKGGKCFPVEGVKFMACPGNFYSWDADLIIRLWWEKTKGTKIFDGNFVDIPAKLIQAFNVLDKMNAKKLKEK